MTIIQRNRTLENYGFKPDGKPNHYKKVTQFYDKNKWGGLMVVTLSVSNSKRAFTLEVSNASTPERYMRLIDVLGDGWSKINTAIRFINLNFGMNITEII